MSLTSIRSKASQGLVSVVLHGSLESNLVDQFTSLVTERSVATFESMQQDPNSIASSVVNVFTITPKQEGFNSYAELFNSLHAKPSTTALLILGEDDESFAPELRADLVKGREFLKAQGSNIFTDVESAATWVNEQSA